ncbi:NADH pyrophosphatase [Paramagnetospirillum magnetotacticum MS-1]|uniref:NAD(+) diphosphatase n=1 Tax=Paramagnetospirillum magnetotacticum MS-1 TaxID=272627 RepID=A0A0C2YU53_PARME|nr:NAD(+) diphosphatase [Paramagnetospirillum magnetotacticum]KIL98638.1 NADH pyrophosphatase [Paramagnetospirillum magnetotacticum MS-1]
MIAPVLYSGLSLDRSHPTRRGGDIAELMRRQGARFTLYWRGRQLVSGTPPKVRWLDRAYGLRLAEATQGTCLLLGEDETGPLLALDISALDGGEQGPEMGGNWVWLRSVGGLLAAQDAGLLAYARGMLIWREKTRFCANCGGALLFQDSGHSAKCVNEACGSLHFPRTDPAIIMLVTDSLGRALLGRQPQWTPGMFSCLAGFVEPGESLEDAVAREVWEEAGIRVNSTTYVASQPWPFPSSLMIGFTASAFDAEPVADPHEIEEVRWFTRDEVRTFGEADRPGEGGRFLPRKDSIARVLVDGWLRG